MLHNDDYVDEENVDNPEPGIVVDSQFRMLSGSGRKSRSTSRSGHSHSPRRRSISVQRVRETRSLNSQDTIVESPNDRVPPPEVITCIG